MRALAYNRQRHEDGLEEASGRIGGLLLLLTTLISPPHDALRAASADGHALSLHELVPSSGTRLGFAPLRWAVALGATLAAACALTATAGANSAHAKTCGDSGYSYAGVIGAGAARGVAVTLVARTQPQVQSGHVAAWVGVGGRGYGPNETDEWIQIGLAGYPDGRNELYYEVALPGQAARYVKLGSAAPGSSYRVAVLEVAAQAGAWRVWLDGRGVSQPVFLPGSHGAWTAVATAESWDGNQPACNRFDYSFSNLLSAATRPGSAWQTIASRQVIQAPGYAVTSVGDGFVARAVA